MSAGSARLGGASTSLGPAVAAAGRWGLRLTALCYLGFMIVLPLSAVISSGFKEGLSAFWRDIVDPTAFGAIKLTIWMALIVAAANALMGTITAYVMVRYDFPGKRILNGLIDLPFAIPTLVTGVMLVALYGPQRTLGAWLTAHGMQIIFATPGIILALLLVTYPFVIRTVQPVLMEVEKGQEEAAFTLGASGWTTFVRVVLPALARAIVTGSLLTFARALGEFGSVVVVAGNIPGRTLTAPVFIYSQIESQSLRSASAMSIFLLAVSFCLIMLIEWLQGRKRKSYVAQ